jgi:hypothetical protein
MMDTSTYLGHDGLLFVTWFVTGRPPTDLEKIWRGIRMVDGPWARHFISFHVVFMNHGRAIS